MKPNRYAQLDSLRGLAALLVVCTHALNVYPIIYNQAPSPWWKAWTPVALLLSGHSSVVFFFVLSGYVLSLPFAKGPVAYGPFLIRRICRIWIPYVVATALAMICALWFYPEANPAFSRWANHAQAAPSWIELAQHLTLVSSFANGTYNPVVWSLVHEMRISLMFPLLFWVSRQGSWRRGLVVAVGLSVLTTVLQHLSDYLGINTDYPLTLHYSGLFLLGILLARHTPTLTNVYLAAPTRLRWLVFLGAIVLYCHPVWLWPGSTVQRIRLFADGLVALPVVVFMVVALAPSRAATILNTPVLVWLGKVSYSVYLSHAVILLSLVHTGWPRVPLPGLLLLLFPLTLMVSAISYRLVELPAIRLGTALSARWTASSTSVFKPQSLAQS
jgi:peptidoglycan/LPS O-acetylase OafA/YrhL